MSDFPPAGMVATPDTAKYSITSKDPAHRVEMDGGFVVTRARYTRRPRKVITVGFTNISEADKVLLMSFWETKRGGSSSFTYTDFSTGSSMTVRFNSIPSFMYAGRGAYKRWNVDGIVLEEV